MPDLAEYVAEHETLSSSESDLLLAGLDDLLNRMCDQPSISALHAGTLQLDQRLMANLRGLGISMLAFSQDEGGVGMSAELLAEVFERLGAKGLPTTLAEAWIAIPMLLRRLDQPTAHSLIQSISAGEDIPSLALTDGGGDLNIAMSGAVLHKSAGDWCLTGHKRMVARSNSACSALVLATLESADGSYCLVHLDADQVERATTLRHRTIVGQTHVDLQFETLKIESRAILYAETPLDRAAMEAAIAPAAVYRGLELVGAATRAMTLAVDHAMERRQFGTPIGSFQSVQHHCVNMLMNVESSRALCHRALGADERALCWEAKIWANKAGRETIRLAHQVMGGMGYIEEHAMPSLFRFARHAEASLGSSFEVAMLAYRTRYEGADK